MRIDRGSTLLPAIHPAVPGASLPIRRPAIAIRSFKLGYSLEEIFPKCVRKAPPQKEGRVVDAHEPITLHELAAELAR